ncbi:Type I secretion system membrane fusion protein PrsE [Roseivivax sp. THAF40]|uniref:HlyD family efflux transporter periplasmic adaptor subunit n=1 Tax=unclassified Roseivivax TaxID=2639302 RepID=UPI0012697EFA|nr:MULTISPECIES: HlyD family efflux transporter periplasmic adaptor subunit [unclassified Roseivivax]QFS81550.1 Type I secretion system membrane fusion protein PrsE [Roseivivax sp. THAF197b]QFT45279.1 Type I secretion system membrane fusion protein PrsE [Roseivivax sp. THAF40]
MAMTSTEIARQLQDRGRGPSMVIWLCAAAVWTFILWASFAWIDEIVRADGELVSSSRPQIIQNLEGGILAELLVAEGDAVRQGDVLARLHGTEYRASVTDLADQITALEIRRLRLESELAGGSDLTLPADLERANPDMARSERQLLTARQADYRSRTEGARRVLEQAAAEKKLMEDLYAKNVVSLIEVTRARKTHADARIQHDEIVTQTALDRAEEHSKTLRELATLRQGMNAARDQLDRTVLVSPMDGVVNKLSVTTIGGVVRPGEEILQIIPREEAALVEARVAPENIANVRPGQMATVKLSAYDYTIWGSLRGAVQIVSADTFEDERDPNAEAHYKVTVRLDTDAMTERQMQIALRPGMQAQVELMTGEKTVLQYLLKPLYKAKDALREP